MTDIEVLFLAIAALANAATCVLIRQRLQRIEDRLSDLERKKKAR